MEKQPRHSRLTVTSSAGTWGCLWLQQPMVVWLTGLQAAPFSSLAPAVTEFAPSLCFLGGTGCLCSPAQPPCVPSLSRTQARDTSLILHPCLQTCGQAGTPLPEMSLKRFRELIPSLLNAWKLLTLNLYRHN